MPFIVKLFQVRHKVLSPLRVLITHFQWKSMICWFVSYNEKSFSSSLARCITSLATRANVELSQQLMARHDKQFCRLIQTAFKCFIVWIDDSSVKWSIKHFQDRLRLSRTLISNESLFSCTCQPLNLSKLLDGLILQITRSDDHNNVSLSPPSNHPSFLHRPINEILVKARYLLFFRIFLSFFLF